MKRDLNLIKEILLFVEAKSDTLPNPIQITGYLEDEVNYHCLLLLESDYIQGQKLGYGNVFPSRLTSKGHDFLDASRDNGIWKKTIETIKEHGGSFTLEIVKTLAIDFAKQKLGIK
jgi:hypothetical protein